MNKAHELFQILASYLDLETTQQCLTCLPHEALLFNLERLLGQKLYSLKDFCSKRVLKISNHEFEIKYNSFSNKLLVYRTNVYDVNILKTYFIENYTKTSFSIYKHKSCIFDFHKFILKGDDIQIKCSKHGKWL